ncbi:MAG: type II toxin-antitoxin system HipA family toxin [Thermoleophilia bacterium]
MTTSEEGPVFVWAWLPGAHDPVVAGRLDRDGGIVTFTYGQSYLAREDAIPLYEPELPLGRGPIAPLVGEIAGCIADAGPDAWGRRVILNRRVGRGATDVTDLDPLTYLIESGSDRIGALDFQSSPTDYVARGSDVATLDQLLEAAELVEAGIPLPPILDQALLHGSSIGGARPKALLSTDDRRFIAKFSSTTDTYPVVQAEFVAMELARRAGLDVAPVSLAEALGKRVLLVERFDRPPGGGRRPMVSALTILGLDAYPGGRYASYADLADTIRARFTEPLPSLRELFSRITFNILVGNNDDHARNQAAFWDGRMLTLTPAYDISPAPRGGGETRQAMAIGADGWRYSQVAGCVERAGAYRLSAPEARAIIDAQIATITGSWDEVCDLARMTEVERAHLWGRQFLNPYALYDYGGDA